MPARLSSSTHPTPPQAIAHRGLHDKVPENTLAAFRAALEAGAEAVELDVHATREGIVVVHHDPVVAGAPADRRLRGVPIADLTLEQVQSFDLGDGALVPRLEEVLMALRGQAAVYVEIKGRTIGHLVAREVRRAGGECAIHAFDHAAIAALADDARGIPRGVLEETAPPDPAAVLQAAGARDLWVHVGAVTAPLVEAVHAAGGRVIAWTANSTVQWEQLGAARVDGICTDALPAFLKWRSTRFR